jgi:hypothetical protein
MNNITLFRMHNKEPQTFDNLKHLSKCKETIQPIFDCTVTSPFIGGFNYDYDQIKNLGYYFEFTDKLKCIKDLCRPDFSEKQFMMWYYSGYSVMNYFLLCPEYDFYNSVEYDCRFNGKWQYFFDIINQDTSDFISPMIIELDRTNKDYDPMIGDDFNYKTVLHAGGYFHRYSNDLLRCVHNELLNGNHAAYEIIFPSIANEFNYSIKDIKELGELYTYESISMNKDDRHKMDLPEFQNKLLHSIL